MVCFVLQGAKICKEASDELNLPTQYDNRYRINFAIKSRNVEDFLKKGRLVGMYFYVFQMIYFKLVNNNLVIDICLMKENTLSAM